MGRKDELDTSRFPIHFLCRNKRDIFARSYRIVYMVKYHRVVSRFVAAVLPGYIYSQM